MWRRTGRSPIPSGCCWWHHKALDPPGDARSDLWFAYHLGKRLRARLAGSADSRDRPLLEVTWDYPESGADAEPSAQAVLQEINGRGPDGSLLSGFGELKPDGSTACGCWIYSGCYAAGVNQTARRRPHAEQSWVAPEWGWAWPANRRMLYNRASADPAGRPWSERKAYVWWDEQAGQWTGHDVPDFEKGKPPDFVPQPDAAGPAALGGADPFIMQRDGKGALFVAMPAWPTGRCPRTTSLPSRRWPTRCTSRTTARPASFTLATARRAVSSAGRPSTRSW